MSKRFIASCTLAAFTFLAVPVTALPAGTTSLVSSTGSVMTKLDGKWTKAVDKLGKGAQIKTAADSSATISLPDGSMVRLAPDSEIAIADINDNGVVVELERGRLLGRAGEGLQVRTDKTVTKATEGEFVVNTSDKGTEMEVLSGNARLRGLEGTKVVEVDPSFKPKVVAQEAGDDAGDGLDEGDVVKGSDGTWLYVSGGILVTAAVFFAATSSDEEDFDPPSPSLP